MATASTKLNIFSGTINSGTTDLIKAGTVTRLEQGSISVTTGTISSGTINAGTINSGTINIGTTINLSRSGTAGLHNGAGSDSLIINTSGLETLTFYMKPSGASGVRLFASGDQGDGNFHDFSYAYDTQGGRKGFYIDENFTDTPYYLPVAGYGSVQFYLSLTATGTQSLYAYAGKGNFPFTNISSGSVIMTGGTLSTGSIKVTSGTVNTGTINSATITAGTINAGTFSMTSGTLNVGTIVNNGGSVNTMGTFVEYSGSATGGTADVIAAVDVSAYRWLSLQIYGTFVGTANVAFSNDNVNFFNAVVQKASNASNTMTSTINATDIYNGPVFGRYFRLRTGAYTSGTIQALAELYSVPMAINTLGVAAVQSGAWSVTGTVATGSIAVTAGTVVNSGGSVQLAYPSFSYFSAAATTTITTTAGIVHTLAIGTVDAAGTLYNSGGTSTAVIYSHPAGVPAVSVPLNVAFGSLTYANPGTPKLTVIYK